MISQVMARPLRVEFEGALYHLTGRSNARQRIFSGDKDCATFVELLVQSLERYDVALRAYVLMSDHFHPIAAINWAEFAIDDRRLAQV